MNPNNDIESFIIDEYSKIFNCKDVKNIIQLKGGTTSLVYLIETVNSKKYVMKIEKTNDDNLLSIEKNTIWWEAKMLKLMEQISIPAPKIVNYQEKNSQNMYSYILMNYIEGTNYSKLKKECSNEEKKYIETRVGEICSKISSISESCFFLPFSPNQVFNNNYEFVLYLFNSILNDAKKFNITIGNYTYQAILDIIGQNKKELNNINKICLVHSDAWDGNILVNNKEISIVDFSDLYFCDELMTFYFHSLENNFSNDFLKGYGKKEFTDDELVRIRIYRLFVLLKMFIEKEIKNFNNKNDLSWIYEKLDTEINLLNKSDKSIGGKK